jgi:hypothetical protein
VGICPIYIKGDFAGLSFSALRSPGFLAMCQDWHYLRDKNRNEGGRFMNRRMILGALAAGYRRAALRLLR